MLENFLTNFWAELHKSNVWWQIVVVTFCVVMSYLVSHSLRKRFPVDVNSLPSEILAAQSFQNMMFPALLWVFVYIGKLILSNVQHPYLLILLIPILASTALIRFASYLTRRIFARNHEIGSTHLLIEKIFSWAVWIIVVLYYTRLLPSILNFMDDSTIPIGRSKISLTEIVQVVVSVVITVLLALWASAALDQRLMKVSSLHSSFRMVLIRLGRSLLILCAVLVSLNLVGIDLTVLSVFGGALGVGLGFGLQKIASNYVSGLIILLDRSLSINDLITVDKYNGRVSEITTRYTVLKGLDGVESIIPNEMLVSSPVQNLSLTDTAVWISTDVGVAYTTDIEALLPMLVEVVSNVERVSKTSMPTANLINFGASSLDLRIGFWINDPENGKLSVLSQVNRAIWKLLQEKKIEVPFPQTEVRILNQA